MGKFSLNPFSGELDLTGGSGGSGGTATSVASADVNNIPQSVTDTLGTSSNLASVLIELTNRTKSYTHSQSSSSLNWVINHNLNALFPIIYLEDSAGQEIFGYRVINRSLNSLTVVFDIPLQGIANLRL